MQKYTLSWFFKHKYESSTSLQTLNMSKTHSLSLVHSNDPSRFLCGSRLTDTPGAWFQVCPQLCLFHFHFHCFWVNSRGSPRPCAGCFCLLSFFSALVIVISALMCFSPAAHVFSVSASTLHSVTLSVCLFRCASGQSLCVFGVLLHFDFLFACLYQRLLSLYFGSWKSLNTEPHGGCWNYFYCVFYFCTLRK